MYMIIVPKDMSLYKHRCEDRKSEMCEFYDYICSYVFGSQFEPEYGGSALLRNIVELYLTA
jgi:hypothetical protein